MANTISQLDLLMLGRRGLLHRLGAVESQVRNLSTGTDLSDEGAAAQGLRANLFLNSSFEFFDNGSQDPQNWTLAGGSGTSAGTGGCDGTYSAKLPAGGASVAQAASQGANLAQCSVVVSVAAHTLVAATGINITLTHAQGYQAAAIMRIGADGTVVQSADCPADGNWYRFYRSFILTGGGPATATIAQTGAGTLEVDAAKFEKEDGVTSWLEPTAFVSADWGAASHIRNLSAENIVTGTLVVGGSASSNPRISVLDSSDVEIVTIGDPSGGFYGVHVKAGAGVQVEDGGSVAVIGGGKVQVQGGVIRAGTDAAERVDILQTGLFSYDENGDLLGSISAVDGKWTITADALSISGTLSLDALTVTGALNVTQDIIIGSDVLFVDASGHNVGINRSPDPQFDLDVNGNMRAGGYIVGRHALQVKGATMICHLDGPEPYASNFTGNPAGHLGQVPDASSSYIFRPGKFGKGVELSEATDNLVLNPSAEVDTTNVTPNAQMTVTRVTTDAKYGLACYRLVSGSTGGDYWAMWLHAAELSGPSSYTASAWVKGTAGQTVRLNIFNGTAETVGALTTLTGDWQRLQTRIDIPFPTPPYIKPMLRLMHDAQTVYVDAVQLENSGYATPYADGSLGQGHSWAGTAHASKSTRAQGTLTFTNKNIFKPKAGSLSLWWTPTGLGSEYADIFTDGTGYEGSIYLSYYKEAQQLIFQLIGPSATAYTAIKGSFVPVAGQSYHIVITWDSVAGDMHLYLNGGVEDTNTNPPPWTPSASLNTATLYFGGPTGIVFPPNGVFDDLAFFDRVLPTTEVLAIYQSDAPIFAETSTWSWRTPTNLAWADAEGLWATRTDGTAAFGVSGVDGKSWGMKTLDAGDVLLGNNTSYVLWDASAATLSIAGDLTAGGGNAILDSTGMHFKTRDIPEWAPAPAPNNITWQTPDVSPVTVVSMEAYTLYTYPHFSISQPDTLSWGGIDIRARSELRLMGGPGNSAYTPYIYVSPDTSVTDTKGVFVNTASSQGQFITLEGYTRFTGDYTTRYFHDDGTYTRFQGSLVVDGDLYVGVTGISWLSGILNQDVRTTAAPTFAAVKASATLNANKVEAYNNNANSLMGVSLFSGEPSISWTNGVVGYNWATSGTGNAARENTNYGGGYIRFKGADGSGELHAVATDGTDYAIAYWGGLAFGFGMAQSANYRISVKGRTADSSTYVYQMLNSDSTKTQYMRGDGYCYTTTAWASSDRNLKRNIRDSDRGLADIRKVRPRRYNRMGMADDIEEHGIIAQEVEAVLPEVVYRDTTANAEAPIIAANYNSLVTILIRAVQQLADEVDTLKAQLTPKGA